MDEQLEFAKYAIQRIDSYYNITNIKASLLLPVNALVIATSITTFADLDKVPPVACSIKLALFLSIILSFLATFFSLRVVMAYLKSGNIDFNYQSLLFFGSISDLESDSFVTEFKNSNKEQFLNDAIKQLHVLSKGLLKKFEYVNYSVYFTGAGLFSLTGAGILLLF